VWNLRPRSTFHHPRIFWNIKDKQQAHEHGTSKHLHIRSLVTFSCLLCDISPVG
jgi:hypothetical protein